MSNNSYLSDALLNRLIAIAPNLQSMSLEGCQVCSFHEGVEVISFPGQFEQIIQLFYD